MKSERYFSFPPFAVDTQEKRLCCEGSDIPLRAKTFSLLCYLLERAGQLVSKDEILQQVWAGTQVAEGTLTISITELRKALGDDAKNPRFIVTVPKRGYRFIGKVTSDQSSVFSLPPLSPFSSQLTTDNRQLTTGFIGRTHELNVLRTALENASAGRGQVVLLAGEAGIGKTRLAEELANEARVRNAQVLIGRCYEGEGAPPFWPWVQVMRIYLSTQDEEAAQEVMGPGAAIIADVLPEVRERFPQLPAPPELATEQARFRFFDSFTVFLKNVAKRQPLVIILDDLHWADTPSLLLLQFIAREVHNAQVLVCGAYRDVEFEPTHPFSRMLGELARLGACQSLFLPRFTESEVGQFMTVTTTHVPSPALITAIHQKTEGNPFFVAEVVQTAVGEGEEAVLVGSGSEQLPLPQRVRVAIERRLQTLSDPCQEMLALAAVIGQEFTVPKLEAVQTSRTPRDASQVLALLNEGIAARFVTPTAHGVGQYRFTHALIRETLYADLREDRRVQFHRRIGEALEYQTTLSHKGPGGSLSSETLAELALHFFYAAPGGNLVKAITYALQAGERAATLFAYEEAALQYERALRLMAASKSDNQQRGEVLLQLAEMQQKAGHAAAAQETCRVIADLARTLGQQGAREQSTSLLARAALGFTTGFGGVAAIGGEENPFIISLLEEALVALGDDDSVLRARVLSRLAMEIYYSRNIERLMFLSQEAVQVARRVRDTATLAHALYTRYTVRALPEQVEERLALSTEIVRLATAAGDKELALRGQRLHLCDLLELSDFATADREFSSYQHRAEELRQPSYLWFAAVWQATRAWLRGNCRESEQYAQEALRIGQRAQDPDAAQCFTAQIFATHAGTRSLQGIEMPVQQFAEHYTALPSWRSTLALMYAGSGAVEEARREIASFAADRFASIPQDGNWLITLVNLAQVYVLLRDPAGAALVYDLLVPHAHRHIIVQPALVFLGSLGRILGMLAATMGRWQEAEAHYEDALRQHREMNARPLIVLTQQQYVPMFFVRNHPGDWDRGMAIIEQAIATAQELGMDESATRLAAMKNRYQDRPLDVKKQQTRSS
jgi:eukaryotic-like serine/threonine-protein kinase